MAGADFYKILGISKDASDSQIRSAYKKLALKHHPDRNRGQEDAAADKFKEVSRAFEVLSDPQKKSVYDKYGEEGLESGGGMGVDPQDLFSQLFGGGGGGGFFGGGRSRGPQGPRKGKDLVHRIKVSLEDLYKGKTSKLALQKSVLCSKCNGKGGKEGAVKTCHTCNGQGIRLVLRQLGPMVQQIQQQCPDCDGQGETIAAKDRCKGCNGKKTASERKVLEVHIDKGMKDGQTITFSGEADQAPGVTPGDVVIVVEEKPHDRFKRKGDDLVTEVHIDLATALCGGKFAIRHLDDRALIVHVQPGEVVKPGSFKVVPDQGMPSYRHHEAGRMIIQVHVDFPDTLDEQCVALLEKALPPRSPLPDFGKNVMLDEVAMQDFDVEAFKQDDAMDEDDDVHGAHPGVSCQNQ